MKVRDLIARLQEMDPELPAAILLGRETAAEEWTEMPIEVSFSTGAYRGEVVRSVGTSGHYVVRRMVTAPHVRIG